MPSARRKHYRNRRRLEKKNVNYGKKLGLLAAFFAVLGLVYLFFLAPHRFGKNSKTIVSVQRHSGDVSAVVIDPRLGEITTLTLPGETEVNVARNLGVMRLKNVWQLGVNEKLSGKLVSETLTGNFGFVNYLWADSSGEGLAGGSVFSLVKFVFAPGKTNIGFRDRLSLLIFYSGVGNSGRMEINLGESQYLVRGRLSDGEAGFKAPSDFPPRLTIYFSDYSLTDKNVRVFIKDFTGKYGVADHFGKMVEIMGAKVVSIEKEKAGDSDCSVTGGDETRVKAVADAFSCRKSIKGDADALVIEIGEKFAERF